MHAGLVDDENRLTVGQFARLAGVSVHALRHYDAIGLLPPAEIDVHNGYRRYMREQLPKAVLIRDLRWLDLPLDQVRTVIADPHSEKSGELLAEHAARLTRRRNHLDRQIARSGEHTTEGVIMPAVVNATVPVQIKVGVEDRGLARKFYADAFGLAESVIRHTDDADFGGYQFGSYGQPGFFLLVFSGQEDFDRPGRTTFGLTVADLDAAHRRALSAGAGEAVPITDHEGMPRSSAVTDPDGNWIWLYQG